jgi:YVTN family beta-propeller protein
MNKTIAGVLALSMAAAPAFAQSGVSAVSTINGNPMAVCGQRAYVSNSYSDTISVIDLATDSLVENLPSGHAPINPTFNRDWSKVYVANAKGGSLTVIDARTGKLIGDIPAGAPHPSGLRFLPDGKHLVISFIGDKVTDTGFLGIMDLGTGRLIKTIPVQAQSERFDITPDGKRAYVGNLVSQTVSVVDLEKYEVIATIPMPERLPFNVLVSPKGTKVFVGNVMGASIVEIDVATNTVEKIIKTPRGPNGMTFTPEGDNILMTNIYAGRLTSYNLSADAVSDGVPAGFLPGFLRLAPNGFKGIIMRPYGRQVSIFDGTTLQITKNIETGIGPGAVAICGNP